jgi:mRNA interferase MazF
MTRGELYLVRRPGSRDPRKQRVFAIVSRQFLVDSRFSTVICAPVYTAYDGISTQVPVGVAEGLKHDSSIHCDELVSIAKTLLSHYVGRLGEAKLMLLNEALKEALEIEEDLAW